MADDRPITPEQALLAVEAAGLDLDRPLNEQLNGPAQPDYETLASRVAELEAKLQEPQDPARAYAEKLRDAQSQWFSIGEGGKDAA
jgi:hypothetical protein